MKFKYSVLLFFLISASANAALFFVDPATGSGVSDSDLTTTTDLVQSAVTSTPPNKLVDQPDSADFILRPKMLRIGEAYILTLSKMKGDQLIFSSQLKAAHLSELDKVAARLTRSVIESRQAVDNPKLGEITDEEEKEGTQRRPARKETYLGLGASNFGNLNSQGIGYSLGVARAWDMNTALLKIIGEGNFNGGAFMLSAGIGANYFLSKEDLAPYVAADFGAGLAKIDGGSAFDGPTVGGFILGVGAGIQILRTSAVNLDLGFRAGMLLHANGYGKPEVLSLRLGLYF